MIKKQKKSPEGGLGKSCLQTFHNAGNCFTHTKLSLEPYFLTIYFRKQKYKKIKMPLTSFLEGRLFEVLFMSHAHALI